MKIKYISLFSLLLPALLAFQAAQSQTLQFAKSFTETGEGIDKRNVWFADSAEQRVAVLFNNGKQTISVHRLVAEIKMPNDSVAKLILKVGSNKNWVADYFEMKELGKYAVSVKDEKGNILAANDLYLRGSESPRTEEEAFQVANVNQTLKYEQSVLTFCEAYKEGKIQNPNTTFKLSGNGKYVEIVLNSDKAIDTDRIMVDVWKKKEEESSFNDHFDSKEFKADKSQKTIVFHYSFRKPGDYKISVFTKDFVWITSGYVSITN